MLKRAFDVVVSGLGLVTIAPLLLVIAALIKLDSPGPVFYRGERVGLFGRKFRIWKFRSMVPDAEARGSTATAHRDPRITRVGRLLRRHKLDELPQLLNVLVGEMSLVGPRPEVEEHTSVYTDEEKAILGVRPGITDYSSLRFIDLNELLGTEDPNRVFIEKYREEKNQLRLQYVRNQSFGEDLRIIARTLARIVWR
jgi:lipopolysaccharide/colanic/teichoic acid biosynthesis glycosyltransferase